MNEVALTSTPNPETDELVTFVQHQLPGLDAGAYELTVAQTVFDSSNNPISDDSLTNTYTFAVLGDRFALSSPSTTIVSVFPPAGATGEFSAVLPHVVLGEPTLPWTRFPTSALPTTTDVPTWLAVLVLDEDDVAAYPGLALDPVAATIADLFSPQAASGSTLGSNYSYFWEETTVTGLDENESQTDPIMIIDLPLTLFWQIAPTVADLELTAHTRQISLANKPTGPMALKAVKAKDNTDSGGEPLGKTSIVFATRLPQGPQAPTHDSPAQGGRKTYAYLVSLEELEPFLPTAETGGTPAGCSFTPAASLRLAVLKNWTFFTTGDSAGFVNSLEALNGPKTTAGDALNTNLRLNYNGPTSVVGDALSMGFVPLNETLRDGGQTVSWFRGPLTPYENTGMPPTLPITSADAALIFDPTTGLLDTTLAAAWSLGRQLALQDTAFASTLYRWKADKTAAIVSAVEAEFLSQAFKPKDDGGTSSLAPVGISRALRKQALLSLAKGRSAAPAATSSTEPRPPSQANS